MEFTLESIFTPAIIADPYPMYAQLRATNPMLQLPDANLLILSSHALVGGALRSRALGHVDSPGLSDAERRAMNANP